jgi:hypothetical protein
MSPTKSISNQRDMRPISTPNWRADFSSQRAWRFGAGTDQGRIGARQPIRLEFDCCHGTRQRAGPLILFTANQSEIRQIPFIHGFDVKSCNRASKPIHGGLS